MRRRRRLSAFSIWSTKRKKKKAQPLFGWIRTWDQRARRGIRFSAIHHNGVDGTTSHSAHHLQVPLLNMRLVFLLFVVPTICAAFVVPQRSRTSLKNAPLFARKKAADDNMNPAKKAALDGVMQQIERSYGRGSIVKLGDAEGMVVDSIGSGALTLGESFLVSVVLLCSAFLV